MVYEVTVPISFTPNKDLLVSFLVNPLLCSYQIVLVVPVQPVGRLGD